MLYQMWIQTAERRIIGIVDRAFRIVLCAELLVAIIRAATDWQNARGITISLVMAAIATTLTWIFVHRALVRAFYSYIMRVTLQWGRRREENFGR